MLNFLARFGQAKGNQIGRSIVQAIVKFDPETASEAQIAEFEAQLDTLTQRVAVLRREYDKEKGEADAAVAKYQRLYGAAEKLKQQIADPANAEKKTSLEQSLAQLIGNLKAFKPELQREKNEAEQAKAFLDEFEQAAATAATKVTTARQKLKHAQREMESAALAKERAQERSESAAVLAGIRESNDELGTALDAMQSVAQKDRDAAAAADLKSDLLKKNTPLDVEEDPNIKAALGEVDGTQAAPASLDDELASLKL